MRARVVTCAIVLVLAACSSSHRATTTPTTTSTTALTPRVHVQRERQPRNIYAADAANALSPAVRADRSLVYVPNSLSNTVDVIDPHSFAIVEHFATGALPQHIVPAWDLRTLYVTNDRGNSLTPIDPRTGLPGRAIPVEDPYNMYFTPNGRSAIVVAERLARLDFRDPHSFVLQASVHVPCIGVDHIDFSAGGRTLFATCEFSGTVVRVDVGTHKVTGALQLPGLAQPQDIKLDPTGRTFYIADKTRGGVFLLDAHRFVVRGFIKTGIDAHGLYVSRDAKVLYVTNRGSGSVSVIDFARQRVVKTWVLPGGGSPDMGGLSADGTQLWVAGRYNASVYVIDTRTGALLRRIAVGSGPHGVCVFPQPGRYSIGHTGIFR